MKYVSALLASLLVSASLASAASAQERPVITLRPLGLGQGTIGDNAYVGPYGRDLPGVAMFRNRGSAVTPVFADGGVKVPTYQRIENEQTYSQSTLPILDGWHGTLSEGFAF